MKTKKIVIKGLTLLLALNLTLGVSVLFNSSIAHAQTPCADGEKCTDSGLVTPVSTTPTPAKTAPAAKKTPAKSTTKTTTPAIEQKKQKLDAAEKALQDAQAPYNTKLADAKAKLDAAETEAEKAAIQNEIDTLNKIIDPTTSSNVDIKAAAEAKKSAQQSYDKAKTDLGKSTETAQKAYESASAKTTAAENSLSETNNKIDQLEKDIVNEKDPAAKAKLEKELAQQNKNKAKLEKELKTLKDDQNKKADALAGLKTTQSKYEPAKTYEDSGEQELSEPTSPYPYVALPTTAQSFNVQRYLTISPDHGSYFEDETSSTAVNFIVRIINLLVRIIGSIAMLLLIIGGLILITAHGSEPQIEKGKDTIKYALIGLAIALSATLIIAFINNFISIGTTG